jgi:predicted dehydrogenase
MKQVTQRLRDGRIDVLDVPVPTLTDETVLIDIRASLLSAGTERSKVATSRQSLVGKARSRPDQVRQVIEKARRDGIGETVGTVRARLEQPSAIGYSAAGVAIAVGRRVPDIRPGDRVACGGGDYAVHAEIDLVPGNLCVPLAPGVTFEQGAFATVGSIAMHGVRQADVRLGERVAVIGLGLVGQLCGQLLRASGCTVVGVDLSPELVERAVTTGAADEVHERSTMPMRPQECDAVIVTAATPSSDPAELAALLCRDRGRVVIVGDVGMDLPRPPFYEKELELRLSRSYGPGRYDRAYEEHGIDYPIGYVRWTERRNMAAVVDLLAAGRLRVDPLISARIDIAVASEAYDRLLDPGVSPLGLILTYGESERSTPDPPHRPNRPDLTAGTPTAGIIGAGSFAQRLLIPALRETGFALGRVASGSGLSARTAADRFGFDRATTSDEIIDDPGVDLVVIATRHSSHAQLTARALRAGKSVFVEKPPCLTVAELAELKAARVESGCTLTVGFNRRHAELSRTLKTFIHARDAPKELHLRVAAGPLPAGHWLNDLDEGGGRLLGEGCHFVDFACWFMGSLPEQLTCQCPGLGVPMAAAQRFVLTMTFARDSIATVSYGSESAVGVGKEWFEAHSGGRSATLDDFREVVLMDGGRRRRHRDRRRDKGHVAQFRALRSRLASGEPIESPDHLDTMGVTLAALRSAESAGTIDPRG